MPLDSAGHQAPYRPIGLPGSTGPSDDVLVRTGARGPRIGALTAMATLMAVAVLYFGRDIFVPFALAALLGFILDPLVTRLRRWKLPRPAAVGVVVLCTVAVLSATSLFVGSQVVQLSKDLPTYENTIKKKLRALRQAHVGRSLWGDASRMMDVVGTELDALDAADKKPVTPAARVQVEPAPRSALQNIADVVNPILEPLAMAGVVLIFTIIMLLQRNDLRDRLLRLVGGDLHHTTDAWVEAGQRVSRYLISQLLVNLLGFGLPMAIGLMLIGVPGALLWGLLAAMLRFVPFVGPLLAAFFPLTTAFAVDPGWTMVLWTLALFLTLEFVIIYLVEPWVYGASTGLSPVSIIIAAVFWTALWGPIGLILATPLTVCLAVLGRHLPQMQWLDVLLGSSPVFDPPTRLYQRLLAGDVEEAIELADDQIAQHTLQAFYNDIAVPALRLAAHDHTRVASVEHRHRVSTGMAALIRDLREQHPAATPDGPATVLCIGGRWEMDTLAADMLSHAFASTGLRAKPLPASAVTADHINGLDLAGVQVVCLSYFSTTPEAHVRYVARRLMRRQPALHVIVAAWNAPPDLLAPQAAEALGVYAIATGLAETAVRVQAVTHPDQQTGALLAPVPPDEAERLVALADSGVLDPSMRAPLDRAAQRVADIFDTPLAMVSLVNETCQIWHGAAGLDDADTDTGRTSNRDTSLCGHVVALSHTLVIDDIARDPRFAANPAVLASGMRFYAGAPLRTAKGSVIGALCVLDREPRSLNRAEVRLLEAMADDLMAMVAEATAARRHAEASAHTASAGTSSLDAAGPLPSPA